ncbi:MAG: glycoside hydrolase family 3 protein [Oscillospiraceae bacterium]|nr:glycoside hydrolase family 3 protein [Oscillospiraceae bacterium]
MWFKIIALVLALVLLTLCAVFFIPSQRADPEIERLLDSMTTREKICQMMVVSFRIWESVPDKDPGINETVENAATENPKENVVALNDTIRDCLARYPFGGTVLFAENCSDAEQTLRLVAELQQATLAGGGLPLLVGIDQEGGSVTRLSYGTSGVGNMALAATGDPALARRMAEVYGEELRLLGIHTDFAPVLDVNSNPANPVIGIRSFSDDPQTVSEYGLAYLEGLRQTGTIATLKHFPGHGNTATDSHTGFPCIQSSLEELKAFDLVPFRAAVDAGVDMIMTAHIQYPQIETQTYSSISDGEQVCLPATMSRVILSDILRGDMGFEGVIITDALDMGAIKKNFAAEDVLCNTINAGVNMLMLPIVKNNALFLQAMEWTDLAVELAEEGRIDMERVDDSVRRILTLKKKYGLLEQTDFTVTDEQVRAAVEGVGSAAHRQLAQEIAVKSLTLLKNENGAFPLDMQAGQSALILFADSCASRVGTGELVKSMLADAGALPQGAELRVMASTADNAEDCLRAAEEADHVVLVHRTYSAACLDPATGDGLSTPVFDKIIEACHAAGQSVILVSCQLPYDAARFETADAILLAYCSSAMKTPPPASGKGSDYVPNLPAALCACFGMGEPSGRLPVDLPALDGNYQYTDQILFPRS